VKKIKVATAQEYKKGKNEYFKLPSGHIFKLRVLSVRDVEQVLRDLGIAAEPGLSAEEVSKEMKKASIGLAEMIEKLVIRIVAEPKIVPVGVNDPDALTIDDLEAQDSYALFDKAMSVLGITPEKVKERESFR